MRAKNKKSETACMPPPFSIDCPPRVARLRNIIGLIEGELAEGSCNPVACANASVRLIPIGKIAR